MASNKIQIKRSVSNSTVTGLSNGELAFTQASNTFWIGAPDGGSPIRIGGKMTPGTLVANQALVANSTSGINLIKAANVDLQFLSANNDYGTPGYVLTSGGSLNNAYWYSTSAFGVDPNAQYFWTNNHNFSNSITFTQTINGTANNSLYLGGIIASGYVNTSTIAKYVNTDSNSLAANVATLSANNTSYLGGSLASAYQKTGSDLVNNVATMTAYNTSFVGSTTAANVVSNNQLQQNLASYALSSFVTGNYVNSSSLAGAVALLSANNATYLGTVRYDSYQQTGSSLVNNVATMTANSTSWVGSGVGAISAANVVSNTQLSGNLANYAALSGARFTGTVNSTSFTTGTGYGAVSSTGVSVNTTHVAVGNSSVNAIITANSTKVYFTGTSYFANNANYLNGVIGSSYATITYVDSAVYAATGGAANSAYVDSKAAEAYANSVNYIDNSLIAAIETADHAFANAVNVLYANNGVFNGNNQFSGTNTTFNSTVNFQGYVNAKDLYVSNSLTIVGTLTTIDTNNLVVKDNSITIADQQANSSTYADTLDFVLYGEYGNTVNTWFSGVYRDQAASTGTKAVWKFFATDRKPTTIVDETAGNYNLGTLQAYLEPYGTSVGTGTVGGFIANSSKVAIVSNSTFSVSISANTLSLISALTPNNGGTGQTSYSTGDFLYAGNSSSLSKLSVGTAGQVLQISTGNLPTYADLDGGSF